jgi:predicted RNA binding protein YcfA (HicA-like mRNA interferase family)
MKLPRDLDADTLIRVLARIGYRVIRQTGSHIRLHCEHPDHAITIPNHRPLRVGTLSAILADIAEKHGTDRDSLLQRLFP